MPPTRSAKREEDQFLAKYLGWLETAGYDLPFHVIDSKNHAKVTSTGFPDTFASHPDPWRGILAAELKSETGQATAEQWTWLTRLAHQLPPPPDDTAKSRAHLWQPRDEPKILTQMGIPKGAPENCDCPVCLHMAGEDPFPPGRRTLKPPPPKPKCPICGRDTNNRLLQTQGNCGRCRRADVQRYEQALIAERTIDPVSRAPGRIAPP